MFNKLLKIFRSSSLFNWHLYHIRTFERENILLRASLEEVTKQLQDAKQVSMYSRHQAIMQDRSYLEHSAQESLEIINWVKHELRTLYPGIIEKARSKVKYKESNLGGYYGRGK